MHKTKKKKSVRLPSHVIPERYEIMLRPDMEAFVFEGEETITLELHRRIKEITLHARDLEIVSVEWTQLRGASSDTSLDGQSPSIASSSEKRRGNLSKEKIASPGLRSFIQYPINSNSDESNKHLSDIRQSYGGVGSDALLAISGVWAGKVKYNAKAETATFRFPKLLPKGLGKLKLTFRGVLNDQLRGFYRSRYEINGQEKFLATTQFEATDARRAFPCFDEPDKKAVFDVTLIVPSSHEAISNTLPIDIREHEGGIKAIKFAPTPKMSTYLLAFISGEFEYIEGYTKVKSQPINRHATKKQDRTLVRVFVTPGKKHQAKFALETAIRTLEFYEDYFNIKYPLPTLDMIAIPDFAAGAMENWGAVTYRETALLVDPEHSSTTTKQWVAMVVAHELAHQWFGNLVTMEWWTHLWLNEGFASYIEYLAVDKLFPDWHMWTQFVTLDYAAAIQKDALANTHPIEVDVHHPDEIGEIFDDISYRKGASVIRMLASFLGEEDFREGLRHYLKKHAYKNAKTEDLWAAFEQVSGKPVSKMMSIWTRKAGYPLVSVAHKNKNLEFSQQRFYSSPESLAKSKDATVWPIPISFSVPKGKAVTFLMDKKRMRLPSPVGPSFPKLNSGETGFYRVAYEPHVWEWFAPSIEHKALPALDRLGLANNVWTLVESGQVPTSKALALSQSYKAETDYTVWLEIFSNIGRVYRLWYEDATVRRVLEGYVHRLMKNVLRQVGWKEKVQESHTEKLLRVLVLQVAGTFGNPGIIKRSKRLFQKSKKNLNAIPADFRTFVYMHVAENGGEKEFDALKALYLKTTMSEEKNRVGRALAQFRKRTLVKKALTFSLTSNVRSQDALRFNASASGNPIGSEVNWDFLKKHWDWYVQNYGQGGHLLSQVVETIGSLKTFAAANDVTAFFKTHPAPGAERSVKQVVEHIRTNALWVKRDGEDIKKFLIGPI